MTLVTEIKIYSLGVCEECNQPLIVNGSNLVCKNCGLVHDRVIHQPVTLAQESYQAKELVYPDRRFLTPTNKKYKQLSRLNKRFLISSKHDRFNYISKKLYRICLSFELPQQAILRILVLTKQLIAKDKKQKYSSTQLAYIAFIRGVNEYKIYLPRKRILQVFKEYKCKLNFASCNKIRIVFGINQRLSVFDLLRQFESKLLEHFPILEKNDRAFKYAELKKFFQGHKTSSFAVSCLYLAYKDQGKLGERITLKSLTDLFKFHESTIRNNARKLLELSTKEK